MSDFSDHPKIAVYGSPRKREFSAIPKIVISELQRGRIFRSPKIALLVRHERGTFPLSEKSLLRSPRKSDFLAILKIDVYIRHERANFPLSEKSLFRSPRERDLCALQKYAFIRVTTKERIFRFPKIAFRTLRKSYFSALRKITLSDRHERATNPVIEKSIF